MSAASEAERGKAQEERLLRAWATPRGLRYWSAVNNSEVGLWYALTCFAFMLFAGALALLMRAQLAVPENDLLSADLYNQAFTLHGSVMMFLFAVPMFEAVAILLLPQMLGARDLPFPRLSAFGYWCFLLGGIFVCGSIFFDSAPKGGWFMYPPLSTSAEAGVGADIWLLGLSFIEVASIAAAVELIVGVLKCRPPGMRINLIPLYCWYVLIVGVMILFAFPPLIAGDLLFEMERMFDWPFFDPLRGGDPLLWQHLFWIFGHPEVYIIFLPSIALLAMIVPTFAQRPIVGYSWIVLAAVGTGFISFGLWVHHMYTSGLPAISLGFFSAASEAVAIPTGVQIFVFVATLLAGRVIFATPMLFATGALAIFVFGGLTGVMVALAPFDWQVHDSYFVVAHLHYTLIGGMFFPLMAGAYYYYPFLTQKRLSDRIGRIVFWLMFAGFNIAFLPMHLTGLKGMPRRVFTYPSGLGWDWLNLISSVGAAVFASGVLLFVFDAFRPKPESARCGTNPWRAGTLEWMPQIVAGIRSIPAIHSRYPLWDQPGLVEDVQAGRCYLPDAEEGKRETLITSVLDAEPIQCLRVPGPSFMPLIAALLVGGVFILSTFHWFMEALVSGAFGLLAILVWLWRGTAVVPEKPAKDVGLGLTLPLYVSGPASVGWWALVITMIGDFTAFAGLVFGYFFFWTIHEDFLLEAAAGPGVFWPTLAGGLLLAAWLALLAARRRNARGDAGGLRLLLLLSCLLGCAAAAALLYGPWGRLDPTEYVYQSTVWILVVWTSGHIGAGLVAVLYGLARSLGGKLTQAYDIDIHNIVAFWHFLLATMAVTVAVIGWVPLVG